jgi:putative signal transducing protein
MKDPTIVRTFSDRGEAEIARAMLEAEGIEASVTADDVGENVPSFDLSAGLQLVVDAADVDRAHELLDEEISEAELDAAELESEEPT